MDGFTLNKELRKKFPPGHRIRIYAFTAQALPEEQSAILSRGFDGILLKPFREKDLLNLLGLQPNGNPDRSGTPTPVTAPTEFIGSRDQQIRELFVADTLADLDRLKQHYQNQQLDELSFTCHRMAGRIAQFGQDRLAFQLRKMEIDTRNGEYPDLASFETLVVRVEHYIQELSGQDYVERTIGN